MLRGLYSNFNWHRSKIAVAYVQQEYNFVLEYDEKTNL